MYKIAILGCENSHANNFLRVIYKEKLVSDVEVVGVYSYDMEAAQKLHEEYGVAVAESYDAFVGKVDGIMITARHGDNHYKYAKPYLDSGIPMYIDKPITHYLHRSGCKGLHAAAEGSECPGQRWFSVRA